MLHIVVHQHRVLIRKICEENGIDEVAERQEAYEVECRKLNQGILVHWTGCVLKKSTPYQRVRRNRNWYSFRT